MLTLLKAIFICFLMFSSSVVLSDPVQSSNFTLFFLKRDGNDPNLFPIDDIVDASGSHSVKQLPGMKKKWESLSAGFFVGFFNGSELSDRDVVFKLDQLDRFFRNKLNHGQEGTAPLPVYISGFEMYFNVFFRLLFLF